MYNSVIPSKINEIGDAVTNVTRFVINEFGEVDCNTMYELKVILNELIINAVKHGNKEDQSKSVKITAGIDGNDNLVLVVEDEGGGYSREAVHDHISAKDSDFEAYVMKEAGRGILIVKNLCDRMDVNNTGNKVVILKKLHKCN